MRISPFSRIHCSLDHSYIVKVDSFEYDDNKDFMRIFMDVSRTCRGSDGALIIHPYQPCEGGDLNAYIKGHRDRKEVIDEQTIWKLFSQLVLALHYCHDPSSRKNGSTMAIIHRDLKPANSKSRQYLRLQLLIVFQSS
jgi:serine/threonine protein kinase